MRKSLRQAQEELGEEGILEEIGHLSHELSPHSFKKECEERLTTESGGPPATSAFLRCGQNLNAVLRRYVRDDKYSDELCGRICAGFRTHDTKFGTLPPRFNPTKFPNGVPYAKIYGPRWKELKEIVPHFTTVLKYCLASVVHHHDWLEANLPQDHGFRQSRYYQRGWHEKLGVPGGVLVGEMECNVTGMQASGVPLYITTAIKVNELSCRVHALEDAVSDMKKTQKGVLKEMKKLRKSNESLR